jgi:beta-glucosidase
VVNIEPKYPASDSPEDIAATRRAHAYMNEQFLHPALLGRYPPELKEIFGEAWPDFPEDDFKLITQPLDFVGINYYTRSVTQANDSYPLEAGAVRQPRGTYTETGWEVFPQGLTDLLLWFKQTYGDLPVYITENGAAFFDPPVADAGRVRDPLRIDYLRKHLSAIHDAIAAGVDIRGYMAWSLLDNLEWSLGYSKRFGIIHVDYGTLERTPKDSARWYSGIIRSHGRSLSEPLPY